MSTTVVNTTMDELSKQEPTDPSIPPEVVADESCTTASLLQYYDDCADFYDQSDEGAEDTYICVDRVTNSVLRVICNNNAQHTSTRSRKLIDRSQSGRDPLLTPSPAQVIALPTVTTIRPSDSLDDFTSMSVASSSTSSLAPSPTPPLSEDQNTSFTTDSSPSTPHTPKSAHDSPRSATSTPSTLNTSISPINLSRSSASLTSPSPSPSPATVITSPFKILDLGVGTGLASRPLFANLSNPRLSVPRRSSAGEPKLAVPAGTIIPEIWGVDLSPNMLKVSSALPFKHLIAGDLNTRLSDPTLHPDSPLSALPPGYFDIVTCVGTTEFIQDLAFFFDQVNHFLRGNGGLFCGTFPSNQTKTYPSMNWTSVEELTTIAQSQGFQVMEFQQYRGWSVSSEEHVEYIQFMAQKI